MRLWFRKSTDPEGRIQEVLSAYQNEIADRLEEGLREIQERTAALIGDIASAVWRSDQTDVGLQERVLSVLARDSTIKGLIAHTDDRFQALDIRMTGVQESLQAVMAIAGEMRGAGDPGPIPARPEISSVDRDVAMGLQDRMAALQRYLGKVLEYEADRDTAISDWLGRMLAQGNRVLRREADRVSDEVSADVEALTVEATQQVLTKLDEQSRAIAYDLSVQEARIRLAVGEGQQGHADILREQLQALDAIEADLTTDLDERLANLAGLIGDRTTSAVNEAAERVGRQSTDAVTLGVKDLLAVMDRRFAWLEETVSERMAKLEHALGVDTQTVIVPEAEKRIEIP
ncbi:MAG: hypothetical protein ABR600_10045 [Actinomycetota bacterium]